MLLPVVATALALGAAAPWVLAFSWGVPFGQLSMRMVLRSSLASALAAFLLGAFIEGCLAGFNMHGGYAGAIVSGVVVGMVLLATVRRSRHLRGAILLAHRLADADTRAQAWLALQRLFERVQPNDATASHSVYADLLFVVMTPLTEAGYWAEAERLLAKVPSERISLAQQALRAQALATCRVQLRDLRGAREALTTVTRPAESAAIEAWLETTDALLLAVQGDAESALRIVGEQDSARDPSLKQSQRLVRAHAFAALGRADDARRLLAQVAEEVGASAMDRAISPEGPATEIAQEVQREALSKQTQSG